MPAVRTTTDAPKPATRQLTLTGHLLPSSSKLSKASAERVYTDAILPIKPEFTSLIASREKNHEYRTYRIRETVERIWLYTSGPKAGAITHVMVTTRPKIPGQVCDPSGVGNDDFDLGLKKSKFGYPVLGLYQLKTPLKPEAMKQFGLSTPQGLMYATKKLVEGIRLEDMEKLF